MKCKPYLKFYFAVKNFKLYLDNIATDEDDEAKIPVPDDFFYKWLDREKDIKKFVPNQEALDAGSYYGAIWGGGLQVNFEVDKSKLDEHGNSLVGRCARSEQF